MRKIISLPVFSLALLVFFSSCKKDSVTNNVPSASDETINVKITPNQSYQMDLSNAGSVNIRKQAAHFLVSEAQMNSENGNSFYKYIPATDFAGNDEVVLLSTKTVINYSTSNSGECHNSNNNSAAAESTSTVSKSITLKIAVGN